jgi:hypothetical protein
MNKYVIPFPVNEMQESLCPVNPWEKLVGKVIRNKESCMDSVVLFGIKNKDTHDCVYTIAVGDNLCLITKKDLLDHWEILSNDESFSDGDIV